MALRTSPRPQAAALGAAQAEGQAPETPTVANSQASIEADPRYLPGDLVVSRDGRTQYQVQRDGSWRKLAERPALEDAVHARQRHSQDHARVAAKKLEDRSGLITPDSAAPPQLILGDQAEREFKKLTSGGSRS